MNTIRSTAAFTVALCLAPVAWAASNPELAQAQRQYQRDHAYCTGGRSQQDRATCLKEANAAYQEARRGALRNASATDLGNNATKRCEAQADRDREACVERIRGAGNTEGSIKAGGLIRSSETTVR